MPEGTSRLFECDTHTPSSCRQHTLSHAQITKPTFAHALSSFDSPTLPLSLCLSIRLCLSCSLFASHPACVSSRVHALPVYGTNRAARAAEDRRRGRPPPPNGYDYGGRRPRPRPPRPYFRDPRLHYGPVKIVGKADGLWDAKGCLNRAHHDSETDKMSSTPTSIEAASDMAPLLELLVDRYGGALAKWHHASGPPNSSTGTGEGIENGGGRLPSLSESSAADTYGSLQSLVAVMTEWRRQHPNANIHANASVYGIEEAQPGPATYLATCGGGQGLRPPPPATTPTIPKPAAAEPESIELSEATGICNGADKNEQCVDVADSSADTEAAPPRLPDGLCAAQLDREMIRQGVHNATPLQVIGATGDSRLPDEQRTRVSVGISAGANDDGLMERMAHDRCYSIPWQALETIPGFRRNTRTHFERLRWPHLREAAAPPPDSSLPAWWPFGRLHSDLYVANRLSGTHFHKHGAAITSTTGHKLWLLYSPDAQTTALKTERGARVLRASGLLPVCDDDGTAAHSPGNDCHCLGQLHPLQVLRQLGVLKWQTLARGKGTGRGGRRKSRAHSGVLPQLVLQQPGEILVIPSGWLHATVNLEALVSVALRFPREEDG